MSVDLNSMTDQELADLIEDAKQLLTHRQSAAALDEQIGQILADARTSGVADTPAEGADWVQPTSAADAYLIGDVVAHDGKSWVSTVNYNVWAPGVSGWREQAGEDGAVPEYLQPTGGHDAYKTGDRVTWNGGVYRSLIDNNVWAPGDYPQGWEKEE